MKIHLFCDPINLRIRVLIDGVEATEDCDGIRLMVGLGGPNGGPWVSSAYLSIIQYDGEGKIVYDPSVEGAMTVLLCATECDVDPMVLQASMAGRCSLVRAELLH